VRRREFIALRRSRRAPMPIVEFIITARRFLKQLTAEEFMRPNYLMSVRRNDDAGLVCPPGQGRRRWGASREYLQ
jgi:hypothetical protein